MASVSYTHLDVYKRQPVGNTTANVTVKSVASTSSSNANITATYNGTAKVAVLHVNAAGTLSNLTINPDTVFGGASIVASANLSSPAPVNVVVRLSSDNTTVATVPASLTISKGKSFGTFTIKTKAVAADAMANLTATSAGASAFGMVMVNPVEIESVSLNPTIVFGGNTSNGTVTLQNAPPAATVIMLTSGNTTAAKVPRSVTIAKGNTTGVFKVTTSKVKSTEAVQIDATLKNSTENTTLNVNGPLPPVVSGFGDSN